MKFSRILNGPNRRLRLAVLVPGWWLLATIIAVPPPPTPLPATRTFVTATAIPLDADDPDRRRVGRLVFVRGWDLESPDMRFGGISSMQIERGEVTAISDSGTLLRFPLPLREGQVPLRVEPLSSGGTTKRAQDTETFLIADGLAWIAFERLNGVARYRTADWRRESFARPIPMRRWRSNNGAEAMVRLPGGRFLVFAEGRTQDEYSPVVLFDGDPSEPGTGWRMLRYRRAPGFRPTEAALLPDGRLLVLNRRFEWFQGLSASLVVADPPGEGSPGTIVGEEIARLEPPAVIDNMEAMTVTREAGRTIVRLASDNNFLNLQRTLLLEFALEAASD